MDRPNDSQKPAKPKAKKSGAGTIYLIAYNSISALLWAAVLGRTLQLVMQHGTRATFFGAGELTKWVQTLAGLEVVHAAIGLVRAPLLTTVMQVASRFLLVWGVAHNFPAVAAVSPAYSSMLVAWSVTEVIRYAYFAISLSSGGEVPAPLLWLRYNTFFLLYPLGISSECWLVYKAIEPTRAWGIGLEWALIGTLLVYIPGSYVLFTHMMAQRRKVMRAAKGETKAKRAR